MDKQTRNIVAVIASFILPGLGHFTKGQFTKGILILIAGILSAFLMLLLIGFILYPIVWIYGMYDAYKIPVKA
ncbi:MAG: hypothetical protein Q8P05_00895 [Candidatus Diapherotrites archaeon]|nr:hypothetical protein [Candidatus Diapherotrites archaeon]MDZ4256231.1 DUF6677 family protein [archaeon]